MLCYLINKTKINKQGAVKLFFEFMSIADIFVIIILGIIILFCLKKIINHDGCSCCPYKKNCVKENKKNDSDK